MYQPEVRLLQFRQEIEKKSPNNTTKPKRKILKQLYGFAIYAITQMETWHQTGRIHGNICMESFFVVNNETIKLVHRTRDPHLTHPASMEDDLQGLAQTIRQIALLNSIKVLDENHHYYPFIICSTLIAAGRTQEASLYLLEKKKKKIKSQHSSRTETSLTTKNPLFSASTTSVSGMPKEIPTPFEMVYFSSKKSTSCCYCC
ncbi:MAG: hypothetical protein NTV32_09355 [Gammaproteobacteria bacterium]|nr:hypothetical protein [Gammaproteobacteria bacterium]